MVRATFIALVIACPLLSACARGRGPGVEGPQASDLFASYSGSWVIYTPASSKPNGYGSTPVPGPASGSNGSTGTSGGGRSHGAGRGRSTGARDGEVGGPSDRPRYDGGAWSVVTRMARSRPSRMTLNLSQDLFSLQLDDEEPMHVPMGGEPVEIAREGRLVVTILRWEEGIARLERSVQDGGKVIDRFEVKPSGRLMVTRRREGSALDQQELRFVYERAPGSGASAERPGP